MRVLQRSVHAMDSFLQAGILHVFFVQGLFVRSLGCFCYTSIPMLGAEFQRQHLCVQSTACVHLFAMF